MTWTAQSSSGYNYTCQFVGYPGAGLRVDNIPEVLTWAYETLEAYETSGTDPTQANPLTQCSDYPDTAVAAMYGIEIRTGNPGESSSDATISWAPVTTFTDCGQRCMIVSNDSPRSGIFVFQVADAGLSLYQ